MGRSRDSNAAEPTDNISAADDQPFGEYVKMVRRHKLQSRLLTPAEQEEAVAKYQTGMAMTAVAALYGCHRTTIRTLLI